MGPSGPAKAESPKKIIPPSEPIEPGRSTVIITSNESTPGGIPVVPDIGIRDTIPATDEE
jgi:hypothetical protein